MPFTFSHPAIVLPLTYLPKQWFSLTGLVIGSITPDFEYFLRMRIKSIYSHTFDGIFWFDLPLGLLLAFIFHNLIRDRLFNNLPSALQTRLSSLKKFNWNEYFKTKWYLVVISIILGAASHILWDGFTHENGYFVQIFSELASSVVLFENQIPVFKILQHLSSLLGGFLIAYAIYKLPTEEIQEIRINLKYWGLVIGLALITLSLRFLSGLEIRDYGNVIVSGITAIFLGLTLTPIILNNSKKM